MIELLAAALAWLCPPASGRALSTTAPIYLTEVTACRHLAAATIASIDSDVSASMLLAIAWQESRYTQRARTVEAGGKWSCGVMTPEPTRSVAKCRAAIQSLAVGYLAGARHLAVWLQACRRDLACALTGYAGGYRLIVACRSGADWRGCRAASALVRRSRWIERAMRQARF